MKNLLITQSSEYDCGPASLTNAIRYLFDREEILPLVLRQIWLLGNDTFGDDGTPGTHGTSAASMRFMADWLEGCPFPVRTAYLDGAATDVAPGTETWRCLERGGCAVVRCLTGAIPHYVLLTRVLPGGEIGLFDPYEEEPVFTEEGRRVVHGEPRVMNRAVRFPLLNRTDDADYSLGPLDKRRNLLLWRADSPV